MSKTPPANYDGPPEGFEVGEHDRGGRGSSKSNDSRGTGGSNNGPRTKNAVTVEQVKNRTGLSKGGTNGGTK
jgi:hypothetical protein